jgi:hypothetical protein
MSTTIIERTIASATQEAISFSDSAIARLIPIPSGWTKIRIGLRLHFTQGTFVTPTFFAVGLCHGTTKLVNGIDCDHFAGVISDSGFTSNGNTAGSVYFNVNMRPFTRTSSGLSVGTNIAADTRYGNTANLNSADRSPLFVDITKGSPDYTMNIWDSKLGTAHDFTEANFQVMLNDKINPQYDGNAILDTGTDRTIAVDEAADGAFNALSVWWNQSGVTMEVCDLGFAVLA